MSTVAPIEDIDLSWVDLDEKLPCSWVSCEAEAVWRLRCRGCALPALICDGHKRYAEAYQGGLIQCMRCRKAGPNLRDTFDVLPI